MSEGAGEDVAAAGSVRVEVFMFGFGAGDGCDTLEFVFYRTSALLLDLKSRLIWIVPPG